MVCTTASPPILMDILTFIAEVVKAVAWPLTLLLILGTLLFMFRKELKNLAWLKCMMLNLKVNSE